MEEDFKSRREQKDLITKFETSLNEGKTVFFDLDDYQTIVDHYLTKGKNNKALQVCDQGIVLYPYSIDLMLDKAQVLSNLERFEKALDVLDQALNLQPNDGDIYILKGNIDSLQEPTRSRPRFRIASRDTAC